MQRKDADGNPLPKFPKGIQVDVEDQFQSRRYDLKKITKLCNPVDKSGDPVILSGKQKGGPFPITPAAIRNPDAHLVCYQAKQATKFIEQDGCGPLDPTDKGTLIDPPQERHAPVTVYRQPVRGEPVREQESGGTLYSVGKNSAGPLKPLRRAEP